MADETPTVTEASWEEFREAGLLWWINRGLHLFGWAIVVDVDQNDASKVLRVYPARCTFRGFAGESEERGFRKLTKHISDEMPRLFRDAGVNNRTTTD